MSRHPAPGLQRPWRILALACASAALMACSTPPPAPVVDPLFIDDAYATPGTALVAARDLFTISPAMRSFLDAEALRAPLHREPRRALLDALYRSSNGSSDGLRLEYDSTQTRTAAEAFERRSGNCLSLVIMTAAFANALGVSVTFQAVEAGEYLSRVGSLTLASGHVNVVLGPPPLRIRQDRSESDSMVVDFLAPPDLRSLRTRVIGANTVVSMYYNNRAAELLAEDRVDLAYWHAREAVRHDASFLAALNTLGLVHQRAGHLAAAERAYREVLAREPEALAALGNLVALLRTQGRDGDAAPWAERLVALQPVPPFHWLRLGRDAMAAGELEQALALFRRELRRQPEQDEVHFALAEVHARLGDLASAQRHLALAAETSQRLTDKRTYEGKLGRLRAAIRATAMP